MFNGLKSSLEKILLNPATVIS